MPLDGVSEPSGPDLDPLEGFFVYPRKLVRQVDKEGSDSEMENEPQHSFSVVTYNILADVLIKDGCYTHLSASQRYQKWRHPRIMKELQEYDADIVCLQEIEDHHFQDKLQADLSKIGYTSKNAGRLAMAFKTNMFELLDMRSCVLANIADALMKDMDIRPEDKEKIHSDMHRYNLTVLLCRFRCLATNRTVCVGNVHVSWGSLRRPDRQMLQVSCAVSELVRFAGNQDVPHLLVGDFNTPVHFPAYQFLQGKKITIGDKVKHVSSQNDATLYQLVEQYFQLTTELESAYLSVLGHEPEVTNVDVPLPGSNDNCSECLDYLWLSSKTLRATAVLDIPPMGVITESVLLPNAKFPSDHLPLLAHIQFKG